MKKILKILAIALVLVLAGTYAIYALDYKGNYNTTVIVTLNIDDNGNPALVEFIYDSAPTSAVQFWDLFRGSADDIGDASYKIYFELNQSGDTTTKMKRAMLGNGESKDILVEFKNIASGDAVLKVTVRDFAGASVYVKAYSLVIG